MYLGFRVHHPDIWSTFLQTDCCSAICTEVTAICILTLNMGGLGLCPRTRTLLDARAHVGYKDHGARLHVVSQLIQETVESGKTMLANSLPDKESNWEESTTSSVHKLLQQERLVAAV